MIADLHATLDNLKSTFKQVEFRTNYYMLMIQEILKSLDIDISRLKFIKGSDFQLSRPYTLDMYKAHTMISLHEAKHAGAEVVKQSEHPKVTGIMYPTLQALDEEYLKCDIQFGGIDQRKIFMHARKILPMLGYKKRFHLMCPMIPGLRFTKNEPKKSIDDETKNDLLEDIKQMKTKINKINLSNNKITLLDTIDQLHIKINNMDLMEEMDKMSSSNNDSKIDLLDTSKNIKTKINKTYCLSGDINDNCLIVILEKIIFPILNLKGLSFIINRNESFGGKITYDNIDAIKNDFVNHVLHPGDVKLGIIDSLNIILEPIRQAFLTKDMIALMKDAYTN